jgi:monoamine oxidase
LTGQDQQLTADYCVCNIPLSVLIKIPADFSPEMTTAMRGVPYAMAGRAGAQFKRRFWEEDDWIYGGQSFTNVPEIGVLDYPDTDYFAPKGVLLVYYNRGTAAAKVSILSLKERMELAIKYGQRIHPTFAEDFENGFSVAWHRMPYSLGAWPSYTATSRQQYYPRLLEPDGRIYLVGEHLSYITAWMEGAVQAAWLQVAKLHARVMQGG